MSTEDNVRIKAENVNFYYGEKKAIKDLNINF
jgi:ABC-type phosphate transport system ATPase subunit